MNIVPFFRAIRAFIISLTPPASPSPSPPASPSPSPPASPSPSRFPYRFVKGFPDDDENDPTHPTVLFANAASGQLHGEDDMAGLKELISTDSSKFSNMLLSALDTGRFNAFKRVCNQTGAITYIAQLKVTVDLEPLKE